LLSVHRHRLSGGTHLRVTVADFDNRTVASVVDFHTIVTGALHQHCHVWSVNFERLVFTQITDVNNRSPRRDIHLRALIVEIEE